MSRNCIQSRYSCHSYFLRHHTLTSKGTGDAADPIDPTHKGPIMTYLAAVTNATQTSTSGLKWFKVRQPWVLHK